MGGFGSTLGLYFEIAADPSNAEKALKDFQASAASTLGMTSTSFGLIASDIETKMGLAQGSLVRTGLSAQAAAKDLAYLGVGALALGAGALALADHWAEAGTKIFEASEKTGLSARNLSGLRATTMVLGESFDGLTLAVSRMGKNIEAGLRDPASQAGQTLQSLFKSSEDLAKLGLMPLDERIAAVDKRIFSLNTTSQQNLALTALVGRGYNEVRSTLQELARDGYDPLIERAKKLGQYFDEESASRARQFKVELASLKTEMSGLALVAGQSLAPVLERVISLLSTKLDFSIGQNIGQTTRDAAAGMFRMYVAAQSLGASEFFLGDQMDRVTLALAGGAKETQAMTDRLDNLHIMVQAAGKGTDELGDKTAKTHQAHKLWSTDLSALNSIFQELRGTLDPVTQAEERYLQILQRIATATGPSYNAALLEKMALEQRDSTVLKAFLTDQEKIDQAITKHVPNLQALAIAQTLGGNAQLVLIAAQRAALPLEISETNALARMIETSKALTTQFTTSELPARARMELEIKKQMDAAQRAYLQERQHLISKKATTAELEALDRQYTTLTKTLSEQRSAAMVHEGTVARQIFLQVSGAMLDAGINALVYSQNVGQALLAALKATLASLAQTAAMRALEEVATGFAWLSAFPVPQPQFAALAFHSAELWGAIAGISLAGAVAIPGAKATSAAVPGGAIAAIGAASPGGAVAATAGTAAPSALAPGAASAAASGQAKEPTVSQPIVIHIHGDFLSTPNSADVLAKILSDAVEQRDVKLTSRRALLPAYAAR